MYCSNYSVHQLYNANTLINDNCGRLQNLVLLFKTPVDTQKNLPKIYRQFRRALQDGSPACPTQQKGHSAQVVVNNSIVRCLCFSRYCSAASCCAYSQQLQQLHCLHSRCPSVRPARSRASCSVTGIAGSNPTGGMPACLLSVVRCQVEVSATGRCLVQCSPTARACVCVCVCVRVCVCVIRCNNSPLHLQ
jgi:hypothetical protein